MVLTALLLLAQGPPRFDAVVVHTEPGTYMKSYIRCTVLTDGGTLAGFTCESTGVHGETALGKPFVWSNGLFRRLPLPPEAKYGHVYGGNDRVLLGSVSIDYQVRPAVWHRDPEAGWSKPQLKVLSMKTGYATHISPDGTIWVQARDRLTRRLRNGKWEELDFGDFTLVGIDAKGRLFGNRFSGRMEGNHPWGAKPAMWDGTAWQLLRQAKLNPDLGDFGRLAAVNRRGQAVGHYQNQATLWHGAEPEPLLKKRWSFPEDINDSGAVVGTCAVSDIDGSMPFRWSEGTLTDLTHAVPGMKLEAAVKISDTGWIAAKGFIERSARLVLLKPRK